MIGRLEIWGVGGIAEVEPGDDLAAVIAAAGPDLRDGDVVVVTSKVVSKAEGRLVAGDREAAIEAETVRVVAARGDTRIVETRHGFVLAAAGVDASNVPPGTVALLPEDPDRSAGRIRAGLRRRLGVTVAVVVTDTFGRPWRNGLTDVAIGAAGISVLDDHRGRRDPHGRTLEMTVTAVADEIAAAAELVKEKLASVPVAVVRGLRYDVDADGLGARPLVRPADEDLFRLGTQEAKRAAVLDRRTVHAFTSQPVPQAAVERAVAAAVTAPAPLGTRPWRFVVVTERVSALADAVRAAEVADLQLDRVADLQVDRVAGLPADGADDVPADEPGAEIERRVAEGDVLAGAAVIVVPCLIAAATESGAGPARPAVERETLLVSMGAAVENLLVALAAEGVGSAWLPGPMAARDAVRRVLDLPEGWEPVGAVAVGYPAEPAGAAAPADVAGFLLHR